MNAWQDAAHLADRKWDKVMDEVWPEAQAHVARELGAGEPSSIVFSSNTHDFLVRLAAAAPRSGGKLRVLTTDGEFHSARRQLARWEEEGSLAVDRVAAEDFDSFPERFLAAAKAGKHDLILVSQVLFGSGRIFDGLEELAALARTEGPWVVVDGYHAFMAIPQPLAGGIEEQELGSLPRQTDQATSQPLAAIGSTTSAFYLGGGYKYAMAGEGSAFLHAPVGFGPRPPVTGWFAEFEDLSLPPGSVGYAKDARRFLGATFDPSGLYRFNAVQRMLVENGLTTAAISAHVLGLQLQLIGLIGRTLLGDAQLLNPLNGKPHARFLAFRSSNAQRWYEQLKGRNCITDVRGDVLRIGFALYHDAADVDQLAAMLGQLA
ncbi:MAG TPA: class V aminotransferase [Sphingomicrobium sp.]|nr:class V aminotransferase [Sphingomicrobium sp.]